ADALCRQADEQDKKEEAASNQALGLADGPTGPPTAKAEKEIEELQGHSKRREDFIAWSQSREVSVSHTDVFGQVQLSAAEYKGKAVRIKNSTGVAYVVPEDAGLLKLMVDKCSDVSIHVQSSVITSTVELYKCRRLELHLDHPLGTLQVDECDESVAVKFAERDHVGKAYHQNSPGFSISWGLCGTSNSTMVGKAGAFQLLTCMVDAALRTDAVRRGEGEFPLDFGTATAVPDQPEPEAVPADEQRRQEAEKHRLAGNDMFRASDFSQAAALYSLALQLAPELGAVWANRAQCWLKLGNHEKALADAKKCTEVEPMNPKGWFRQGISLHAMQRYTDAIPALLEAGFKKVCEGQWDWLRID
ncbi:Sgta, partial [Symbiodinium pilosum]